MLRLGAGGQQGKQVVAAHAGRVLAQARQQQEMQLARAQPGQVLAEVGHQGQHQPVEQGLRGGAAVVVVQCVSGLAK